MRIKQTRPIKELLAQLPPDALTRADIEMLTALRACITALRGPISASVNANVFTPDTRLSLALELTDAVAQVISTALPRRAPGRPAVSSTTERRAQVADADAYKDRVIDMQAALTRFATAIRITLGRKGQRIDTSSRQAHVAPALEAMTQALIVLQATPAPSEAMMALAEDMTDYHDKIAHAAPVWAAVEGVLDTDDKGPVTWPSFIAWTASCATLKREAMACIKRLKT